MKTFNENEIKGLKRYERSLKRAGLRLGKLPFREQAHYNKLYQSCFPEDLKEKDLSSREKVLPAKVIADMEDKSDFTGGGLRKPDLAARHRQMERQADIQIKETTPACSSAELLERKFIIKARQQLKDGVDKKEMLKDLNAWADTCNKRGLTPTINIIPKPLSWYKQNQVRSFLSPDKLLKEEKDLQQLKKRIPLILKALTPKQRRVFTLKRGILTEGFSETKTFEEIAEMLNRGVSTVKSLYYTSERKLAKSSLFLDLKAKHSK